MSDLGEVLALVDGWEPETVAVAVIGPDGVIASHGPQDQRLAWASISKIASAWATLITVQDGALHLDEPVDVVDGVDLTVRHLLAHASGLPGLAGGRAVTPGTRRVYSNDGYERLATYVEARVGEPFADLVAAEVFAPLGMTGTALEGSAAHAVFGPAEDLVRLAYELLRPTLLDAELFAEATTPQFPDLVGVVPAFGRQDPCPWGLGPEVKGTKSPHWTAPGGAPATFGHYGGAGSFLWVDPEADIATIELADLDFGPWASAVWPDFNQQVLDAAG